MKRVILLILDGWGIGKKDSSDAIFNAKTPFMDSLSTKPHSTLKTFGENVGLPEGQMGNSEVGHMNIGAGRVVWQMLVRINKAFKNKTVQDLPAVQEIVSKATTGKTKNIHLFGLVSDGGVHSSQEHLLDLTEMFKELGLDDRVFVHAFTDGRDTDPKSGKQFVNYVTTNERFGKARLVSICGRYYAMDRDKRWERTKLAYDLLLNGTGDEYANANDAFDANYKADVTDEFLKPIKLANYQPIKDGDIVLCFNFRTDRARQLSAVFTQKSMHEYNMHVLPIDYYTMTEYDKTYENVGVLFDNQDLKNTLGEVLAKSAKKQLRSAETEKYPHVTFFFNGGREEPFDGEDRLMANSPKAATYDLQPEMSAIELTEKLTDKIRGNEYDFMCINYANPDMVGHTGVFSAIEKACETVDTCAETLVMEGKKLGYEFIIIADHGNADKAVNEDGSPNTAHTNNLVPCYYLGENDVKLDDGKLADIAPTVLDLMGLKQPQEMDGVSLLRD